MEQMEIHTLKYLKGIDSEIDKVLYRPANKAALYKFTVRTNSWTSNPAPIGKLFLCRRSTNPTTYVLVLLGRTEGRYWVYHIVPDTQVHLDDQHPRIDLEDSAHPGEVFGLFFSNSHDSRDCLAQLQSLPR
ncbi:hypothetical protein PTSG_00326 [Salpingoeca rosetta]|uniref:Uncharacterized protein n=1 Tax=Salpingoeca rosetta (strain ATCC 50818 / BSB-021) TaxID=946362 RepID=F2TW62_SALR5|nr:uncharacterized protein PTSG_00326 [Salpingoeca rosetta]EGD72308.1 hypothetical protein PTSG_00326 [Salpingoeca rosetta]|eukprot:XP_004998878.1 hypothetical protein PTSG_00326 [Salpingoeca rosetta]